MPASEELRRALAEHGWLVATTPAAGERPRATSTVGLTTRGMAELVVLGLPDDVGGALLHELAERLLAGGDLPDRQPLPGLVDGDAAPVLVPVTRPLTGLPAQELYGDGTAFRQLVWPDAGGRLPWHPGFAHPRLQPLLGDPPPAPRPAVDVTGPPLPEWPLEEDPHRAVRTSRRVSDDGAAVLMVVRTDDGELRFLDGRSDFDPGAATLECLHDALERDLTLIEAVHRLGNGRLAERDAPGAPWRLDDW